MPGLRSSGKIFAMLSDVEGDAHEWNFLAGEALAFVRPEQRTSGARPRQGAHASAQSG